MTSLTAGSPICNCKNPDTCIHSFTLKVKDRTFNYKQDKFISMVETIDEGGKGVPLSLTLQDKQCVSHNPQCPQGMIYNLANETSAMLFHKGLSQYNAHFDASKLNFFTVYDSMSFLVDYILAKDAMQVLPMTSYMLRVGQCGGEAFISRPLTFIDGMSQIFNFAPRDALWSYIHVYPELKWEVSVALGLAGEREEFTDRQCKKQQKAENTNKGLPQRGHRGWTNRPKSEITSSLEMEGKLTAQLGSVTHDYSRTVTSDFRKNPNKLSLLNKAVDTIGLLTKALSTKSSAGGDIKLLKTEFIYPKIEIKGSGELKEDTSAESLYMESRVALELAPLIGLKMTFDLVQAFAAWYGMDAFIAAVREQMMAGEDEINKGKNAAYAGIKIDLILQGELNFSIAFKTDAERKWTFDQGADTEIQLAITLEAQVRAGVRFHIVEGFLNMGGTATAKAGIWLDNKMKDKLDLVFFHNGITAKVYVSYTVGLSAESDSANDSSGPTKKKFTSQKVDENEKKEEKWIIYEKLEKKDSKYRFNFL